MRGFTIVEVLVAIVILALGVLGIAATAGSVSRLIGGGAEQTIAADIAAARFEQLRGGECASIADGTATTRGMTESWHATTVSNGLHVIVDTVTYVAAGGRRPTPLAFSSSIKC